jgi:hypothetical protein
MNQQLIAIEGFYSKMEELNKALDMKLISINEYISKRSATYWLFVCVINAVIHLGINYMSYMVSKIPGLYQQISSYRRICYT